MSTVHVHVITLPYHLDRAERGTGAGPQRLLDEGLAGALASAGHELSGVTTVRLDREHGHETANVFALVRGLAARVRASREAGEFPLVLAGDCYNAIGVLAGLGASPSPGLVWLDSHGDANTPETTTSGFFDGFPLAIVLGWCWSRMAAGLPGFAPADPGSVLHLGGRDFDPGEREAIEEAGVGVIDAAAWRAPGGRARVGEALEALAVSAASGGVHVHLDLDVIDPADGIASTYATDGGPRLETVSDTLRSLAARTRITSAAISAYDPAFDSDGRAARAGIALLEALLAR